MAAEDCVVRPQTVTDDFSLYDRSREFIERQIALFFGFGVESQLRDFALQQGLPIT